ncbi:hypothetical protein BBF96_05275 [Anoxybacter fermentans]|uniref:HTH lacI-type domain-containing protein n=2 Tax=Anoxybacter fermentans TaxID=1323375 RepID=A0A3Q9HUT4_9FIRM|nr:hypothetical protein BBF96_05275 [Anoxybacter fermentans]
MDEVAKLAGVSKATVSRVLNKSDLVQPETREKVIWAMEKLNYKPNMIARYLRKQETELIGIILPDMSNPFYSKVLKGIEEVAYKFGYDVVLMNTNYSEEREKNSFKTLLERRAEGVLFMCHRLDNEKMKWLEEFTLPSVIISRTIRNNHKIPFVNIDNVQGGYDATRYLISLGHRKIAMISGPFDDENSSLDRIAGYIKAISEANIPFNDHYLKEGDFTFVTAEKLVKELLTLPDPPTAIFAVSDETAIGAIRGALDLGYKVPEDLSIIGFDNLEIASYYNPTLTTIAQPMTEMGRRATQILINIIEKRLIKELQVILPHKLIVRESTAQYR